MNPLSRKIRIFSQSEGEMLSRKRRGEKHEGGCLGGSDMSFHG